MKYIIAAIIATVLYCQVPQIGVPGSQCTSCRQPKYLPPQPEPKSDPKYLPPKEVYNPDTLPSYEVACGRQGAKNAAPCHCVKEKMKVQDEAFAKCDFILDKKERMECLSKVPECRDIKVADVDDARRSTWENDGKNAMPAKCLRSCSKARCECCTS